MNYASRTLEIWHLLCTVLTVDKSYRWRHYEYFKFDECILNYFEHILYVFWLKTYFSNLILMPFFWEFKNVLNFLCLSSQIEKQCHMETYFIEIKIQNYTILMNISACFVAKPILTVFNCHQIGRNCFVYNFIDTLNQTRLNFIKSAYYLGNVFKLCSNWIKSLVFEKWLVHCAVHSMTTILSSVAKRQHNSI